MSSFAWAALASLCWGFAPLFEKAGLRGQADPVLGVWIRSAGVLVGLAVLSLTTSDLWGRLATYSTRTWVCLGLGGILASIFGQICFYRALKTGDISRVVPIGASYPVIAALLAVVFFAEPMTLKKTLGIALIVGGTLLLR